jgi:DNA-directed RNA polymerase specialized sigma24 family protein
LDLNALGTGEQHGAAELDAALDELEASSPRVARLVIYRFFGDLSVEQSAERLGISVSTAEADWRFARAWLRRRLKGTGDTA